MEELVIKFPEPKPLPLGVHVCPRCWGSRHEQDGWVSVSNTEIRSKPASKCLMCSGSGTVRIEPYGEAPK